MTTVSGLYTSTCNSWRYLIIIVSCCMEGFSALWKHYLVNLKRQPFIITVWQFQPMWKMFQSRTRLIANHWKTNKWVLGVFMFPNINTVSGYGHCKTLYCLTVASHIAPSRHHNFTQAVALWRACKANHLAITQLVSTSIQLHTPRNPAVAIAAISMLPQCCHLYFSLQSVVNCDDQ